MTLCEGNGIFLKNNFLFANGSVKSLYFCIEMQLRCFLSNKIVLSCRNGGDDGSSFVKEQCLVSSSSSTTWTTPGTS